MADRDEALPFLRSVLYTYLFRRHGQPTPAYIAELRRAWGPDAFRQLTDGLAWAASDTAYSFSALPEVADATEAEIREHFGRLLALIRSSGQAEPVTAADPPKAAGG